ncbi:MAG TPA: EpsI family protein [Pyrinomonadaceae bacterium]|nr:EpsI family protein [Pyrinomonadaceae bacterium]
MQQVVFDRSVVWKPIAVGLAIVFLYSAVLPKLFRDWWLDENYSHGLLMPFVLAYILWSERASLQQALRDPRPVVGFTVILAAVGLLLFGTLGSELFTQRVSLVVLLAGVTIYFFGFLVLRHVLVPLLLLLLSIPIPQVIFNNIAMPLQSIASRIAGYGLTAFGLDVARKGNVIELIPLGATQVVGLEVVEACSGIRSLMSLVALAVILVYLTRRENLNGNGGFFSFVKDPDFIRGILLVLSAVPIALITNSTRVTLTGIFTYYWNRQGSTGVLHDALGWVTFFSGLVLLVIFSEILRHLFARWNTSDVPGLKELSSRLTGGGVRTLATVVVIVVLVIGGLFINWFAHRAELPPERRPLVEMPRKIGEWWRLYDDDRRFSPETEEILKSSDYIMRNYWTLLGRRANLYVGYYESQRTGSTYHSPQSCLPGGGWQMRDGKRLWFKTDAGRTIQVNRYIVERAGKREVMIYWYQGRGRVDASEYTDKLYKIYDSIFRRRSDGAMVRIMTPIFDGDETGAQADADAFDLAVTVADALPPYVPD